MFRALALLALLFTAASTVRAESETTAPSSECPGTRKTAPSPGDDPTALGVEALAIDEEPAHPPIQRSWGQVGIYGYAVGSKMAPNGLTYDPLFSLDLTVNVALTGDRRVYLFSDSRFWAQNNFSGDVAHGPFDFSKRQYDLDGGVALGYFGSFETRVFAYSCNNLNRGNSLSRPFGYNDGYAVENRFYFDSTNFDKGLYRFLTLGYFPSKDLVGGDGHLFAPGLFARASLALDIFPDHLYLYSDTEIICRRPVNKAKLLLADVGVALRPFTCAPDVEFRIGSDNTWDIEVSNMRTLIYGNVRVVW
jgi:hypothetical protein